MYTLYRGGTGQLFADPLHLLGIENEFDKCLNICDIKYIITNAEKWSKYLTLKATVYVIKTGNRLQELTYKVTTVLSWTMIFEPKLADNN